VCSFGALPFVVTVDPDGSFFTLEKGLATEGFDALPQAFLPEFGVYLEKNHAYLLELAARLTYALQKTTARTLRPQLLAKPEPTPLLAIGGEDLAETLQAPLRGPGLVLTDLSGKTWLKVEANSPYASLQAFPKDGRYVLLLSYANGGQNLMAPLVEKILEPEGWFGLHGDTALIQPGAKPVVFKLNQSALRIRGSWKEKLVWIGPYRYYLLTAVLLGLILLLIWTYPRVVRPQS